MKVAVTYFEGEVFPHFGRTEFFKIYEIENNEVINSNVVSSNGIGHGALAGVLANYGVNVLICGGIGAGAINALANEDIAVINGVMGNVDEIIKLYLENKLETTNHATCNHHDHDHDHDHEHCGCGCHH